jgi:plasmid stabilization system protein ParE
LKGVEFHPEAQAELFAAAQYFEDKCDRLGLDFIVAVERTYRRILRFPGSGRPFGARLRRVLVPGYPYGLVYRNEPRRILRVAVAHLSRRPGFWRLRA